MVRTNASVVALVAAVVLAAGFGKQQVGKRGIPEGQLGSPSPPTQTFQITGTVSNHLGIPLAGVRVLVAPAPRGGAADARTDALGRYAVAVTSPSGRPTEIQVISDDKTYQWYRRPVALTSPHIVEDVALRPAVHVQAGDQASIVLTPDNGRCWDFFVEPCAQLWVHAPADGTLTIEITSQDPDPAGTRLAASVSDLCGGNPAKGKVNRGEVWVAIGGITNRDFKPGADPVTRTVVVKTSFQPF